MFSRTTICNLMTVTDIQSRRSMEATFRSQIDEVLADMKKLVSHNLGRPTVGVPDAAIQARFH